MRAFNHQREALQISVFNELTKRIDELHDNLLAKGDKIDKATFMYFNLNMLNALNQFAFYANRGDLRPDMVNARARYTLFVCEKVAKEWPEFPELYRKKEEEGITFYPDLGIFYERVTGKKFPLWGGGIYKEK